jgi:hypothetical protein
LSLQIKQTITSPRPQFRIATPNSLPTPCMRIPSAFRQRRYTDGCKMNTASHSPSAPVADVATDLIDLSSPHSFLTFLCSLSLSLRHCPPKPELIARRSNGMARNRNREWSQVAPPTSGPRALTRLPHPSRSPPLFQLPLHLSP